MKVCLMIVNQSSRTRDRYYDFSDECPRSQGDVLAEAARAWVPNGFELYEDFMMSGFAFETNFGVGGHWKHEDCIRDGVDGRCAYGRLASKNECAAGVTLGVEWVVHNRFVVDYTRFSTSGRVDKGGILEYVAFLPRSSWDKPMSAVPWAELVEVRCN
jgi:hypothetical protein